MKDRAKQVAKYYNQCKLPKWATVLGVVLLAFRIVAAGVTAIFHDKYSSIFGEWESALTNVWFIAFISLVGVGALISLGYPLLTLIGAWIWTLFAKPEPEAAKELSPLETPEIKDGDLCVFEWYQAGLRNGEIVLTQSSEDDIDYGGKYTIKKYCSEKIENNEGWQHTRVTLQPLNPTYSPIEIDPSESSLNKTIGIFKTVISNTE